jgi:KUP system potassium uptake protein
MPQSQPSDTSSTTATPMPTGAAAEVRPSREAKLAPHAHGSSARTRSLALAALGVVYGDIGTSPLYAFRECFHGAYGTEPTRPDVLGVLSLFFWSLVLVIVVKYILFVMRANNEGEGGVLALLALVLSRRGTVSTGLVLAGLFGASLLYADGMLTPAISVISAVEGIENIEGLGAGIEASVVPISIVILIALFLVQRRGTARVGAVFGPIVALWFVTIGGAGAYWIVQRPEVLEALSPHHALWFFARHSLSGFWVLGSVVLCITGGEALYADMGHFGRRPIMIAWFLAAFPALVLNYFGQGALVLDDPAHVEAPFFRMFTPALTLPIVVLATAATVIASQALISGAFSLTRQAIQLGYLPRLEIRHTSSETEGQIYLPDVNRGLMIACIVAVLVFRSSSNMAAAYGIAVTGTMAITTVLFFVVARGWWGTARAALVAGAMLAIDLAFFGSNLHKLSSGGWIPLAVAAAVLSTMTIWKDGRSRVGKFLRDRSRPLDAFLDEIDARDPHRVAGTAVFMTSTLGGTPPVLLHHYKHNKVLHEQVVLLSVVTEDVPTVPRSDRVVVERLREGFFRVTARYGFMQSPRVTEILRACHDAGLRTQPDTTSFYLGREKLVVTKNPGMSAWRKIVFAFLSRNSRAATDFFKLPPDRVVEMGMQLEL